MEAKTINDIADEMGVASVYLEPILNQMTTLKLLVSHTKGKIHLRNILLKGR